MRVEAVYEKHNSEKHCMYKKKSNETKYSMIPLKKKLRAQSKARGPRILRHGPIGVCNFKSKKAVQKFQSMNTC